MKTKNFSPWTKRAAYRVAVSLLGAIIEAERIIFGCTGYELPALRRYWSVRGERTQELLNREHRTEIEYGIYKY